MCGIAGFISANKDYNAGQIVSDMLNRMPYRGPDQTNVKTYRDVTLGMLRLSIIDKETHTIPYEDKSGNFAMVYNGEIYNHDQIRNTLASKYTFKTNSDAETALYNYIHAGTKAFNDYNGMYAFAVYNGLEDATYVVRDKAGEKPLYYTTGKDYLAFSSEIKCLLGLVKPEFDKEAISYQAYEFVTGKQTLFRNIYCLEPGEYLKCNGKAWTVYSYWKIWDNLIEVPDDRKKLLSALSELIEDAIHLRTKNAVHQFGCFVSGGIDSSLVACISKPDFLYYLHYDYDDFDELHYAQLVAKKIKRDLIIVTPDKKDFERTRERITYHLDTPCTWTSFSLWMLIERAAKDLKIVMTGDGADEIFAGYHRYHLLHHDEQIHRLQAMKQYSYLIDRYYGSPVDRYVKLVNRSENQYDETVINYLREDIGAYFERANRDVIHSMGINDFYTTMQVLLQMSDRLCMAFSIENRSPFLDYRVIQFGFSMPSKYKIKDGVTKWALKEVAKKFIPKEIVKRIDKRGFSAPVNRWFKWDRHGKYDRSSYRKLVLADWQKVFFNGKHFNN